MNPKTGSYDRGQVHVGKGAYSGMGTMVVKPVTIGEGAIVGAGAIVTKDIPSNEVWAGNPALYQKTIKLCQTQYFLQNTEVVILTTFPFLLN